MSVLYEATLMVTGRVECIWQYRIKHFLETNIDKIRSFYLDEKNKNNMLH